MTLYFQIQFLKLKCTENTKSTIKTALKSERAKVRYYRDPESKRQYQKRKYQENSEQNKDYRKKKYQEIPTPKKMNMKN